MSINAAGNYRLLMTMAAEVLAHGEQPLPVVRVGEIPRDDHAQRWLVQQLWGASAV